MPSWLYSDQSQRCSQSGLCVMCFSFLGGGIFWNAGFQVCDFVSAAIHKVQSSPLFTSDAIGGANHVDHRLVGGCQRLQTLPKLCSLLRAPLPFGATEIHKCCFSILFECCSKQKKQFSSGVETQARVASFALRLQSPRLQVWGIQVRW